MDDVIISVAFFSKLPDDSILLSQYLVNLLQFLRLSLSKYNDILEKTMMIDRWTKYPNYFLGFYLHVFFVNSFK